MGKSVLDGCGRYTDILNEIKKAEVENRISNGEVPTQIDIWKIDSEIFEAYQTILATVKDPNLIQESIINLRNAVEGSGITNISNKAVLAAEQALVKQEKHIIDNKEKANMAEIYAEGAMAGSLVQDVYDNSNMEALEYFLSTETLENIDETLEKVKEGDEESAGSLEIFNMASDFLVTHNELDEKSIRQALALIGRLNISGTKENIEMALKFSEEYNLDLKGIDENGEECIDKEKFECIYRKNVEKEFDDIKMKNKQIELR